MASVFRVREMEMRGGYITPLSMEIGSLPSANDHCRLLTLQTRRVLLAMAAGIEAHGS